MEQGSDQWLEIRHGKVGGSTLKKIMSNIDKPIRSCSGYYSILAEQMEDFDPFDESFKSFAMQRGNDLEPEARKEYERINGVVVGQYGWIEISDKVGISPDGWIQESKKAIEIKCPNADTHVKYMMDINEFLEEYVWQLVHTFNILDVDTVDCISYRPENNINPIVIYTVNKDTVIKMSAKVSKTITELVEMSKNRLKELFEAIEVDINKHKQLKF